MALITPRLRVAIIVNWRDKGNWIWNYLPSDSGLSGDLLIAAPSEELLANRKLGGKKPFPYWDEFQSLYSSPHQWNEYDVVFCWELRTLVAAILVRQLCRQTKARLVVIAPIFKGGVLKILPLLRALLRDVARFVCVTTGECDYYANLLKLPRERFVFEPLAWLPDESPVYQHKDFALALGHSNRDYGLLLDAIEGTDIPLIIVAANGNFLKGRTLPPHVTVKFNTGHEETNTLIADAAFHIIPLHDVPYSSGATVLLRAMARGKAVIASDTTGLRDYIRDGETGLLVPPGNVEVLRSAIERLWNHPETRDTIGRAAADSVRAEFTFPRFASSMARIARELVPE